MVTALRLVHYKNHSDATFQFGPGLNVFTGRNGIGKTNLLDAIYYLCMARSHHTPQDRDTVTFGESFFRLEGEVFFDQKKHLVSIKVKPGSLKEISVDGEKFGRLSDYIGFVPVVILAPEDILLIRGGSAGRRRFMDLMICQADKTYLEQLQRYQRLLHQRNALLRRHGWNADRKLLMTYSEAMQEPASFIDQNRKLLIADLQGDVKAYYKALSGGREIPLLQYDGLSDKDDLISLAASSLEADLNSGFTTKGVHKHDLVILLDQKRAKGFGSQGQVKSLLISLFLAQMALLRRRTGRAPILLLDDIFDRLDESRAAELVRILADLQHSQVFLTDASPAQIACLTADSASAINVMELGDKPDGIREKNDNLQDHGYEEE